MNITVPQPWSSNFEPILDEYCSLMLEVSTKIIRIFEKIFSIENEELSRSIRNEPTWSLLPLKYEHNRQGSASPGTSTWQVLLALQSFFIILLNL